MTDERFNISRRKALASLGTIGVASAGAGLGTSAYFSDQETFQNNELTAGTLDLGVGYSAHYSDWSDDESDGVSDVVMYDGAAGETGSASDLDPGYTGLPSNDAWLIAVPDGDVSTFLANTQQGEVVNQGCDSDGISALTQADGESAIIDLGDVKPGDFGEVTFDLELCTNPGYVWMNNPGGFTADENGVTEPEADDPDEESGTVELLDVVQAAVWLDDGNNYQNGGEKPILVDSLRNVLNELNSSNGVRIDGVNKPLNDADPADFTRVGVNRFDTDDDGDYDLDFELTDDPDGSGKVAHGTSGGGPTKDYATTAVSVGETIDDIDTLSYQYYEGSSNTNTLPDEVYLLIKESDGTRHVAFRSAELGTAADGVINNSWQTREVLLDSDPEDTTTFAWTEVGEGALGQSPEAEYGSDATILAMGVGLGNTLGDADGAGTSDIYYKNPQVDTGDGTESLGSFPTACFRGETEFSAVFAWWVPIDHGNEMQSDKVEFDLGFYTEQCRHNDGSGMDNTNGSANKTDDTNVTTT